MNKTVASSPTAVFTNGSILRHILVMSSTSAIGLLSLFAVDLLDMYFLSLLGEPEIVAAVGFSSTLMFLLFSCCIGMQIGMGALVARAEGQHQRALAGRYCTNVWIVSFSVLAILVSLIWISLPNLLRFVGAEGKTFDYALSYSQIMLPSLLLVSISMCGGAALRGIGDAKRSMFCTMSGGLTNAILDPVFIFVFEWGVEGAAFASVAARVSVLLLTLHAVVLHHRLPKATSFAFFKEDFPKIARVAFPALVTNLMTPIAGAFVLKLASAYGAAAVAGYAVMGRLIPVAFGFLFSLSGAVGPIIGQNAGARQYARVRETLIRSIQVVILYVLVIWALLYLMQSHIVSVFALKDAGVEVFRIYCNYLVGFFCFAGLLFISNAAFNNLNRAHWSMFFNFSRTFLGVIPLAYLLSGQFGLIGLMFGDVSGAVIYGSIAFVLALSLVNKLEAKQKERVN